MPKGNEVRYGSLLANRLKRFDIMSLQIANRLWKLGSVYDILAYRIRGSPIHVHIYNGILVTI